MMAIIGPIIDRGDGDDDDDGDHTAHCFPARAAAFPPPTVGGSISFKIKSILHCKSFTEIM